MCRVVVILIMTVLFAACKDNDLRAGQKTSLSSLDANTAGRPSYSKEDIIIQPFVQMPSVIHDCNALFTTDTNSRAGEYYFINDLQGTAFIKLNNRLTELKLLKQTYVDKYTVNELYVNDEVEVELKIKQTENAGNTEWNYKGVLIVRKGEKDLAINISGKLGC